MSLQHCNAAAKGMIAISAGKSQQEIVLVDPGKQRSVTYMSSLKCLADIFICVGDMVECPWSFKSLCFCHMFNS